MERHQTNGLYMLGSLTVQKLYTDASDTTQAGNTHGTGNQGNNGQFSPYHLFPRAWALAADNVPVTFQLASVYELPFGAKKKYLNNAGAANVLIGGWQVSAAVALGVWDAILVLLLVVHNLHAGSSVPRGLRSRQLNPVRKFSRMDATDSILHRGYLLQPGRL